MKKSLEQLHKEFISEQEFSCKLRPETIRGYNSTFNLFIKLMPGITPDMLSENTMTEFFRRMDKRPRVVGKGEIRKGVKRTTIATKRSKLNKFFEWLRIKGHIKENPFRDMEYPTVRYEDVKYLKKEEVEAIFNAIGFKIKWTNHFVKKRNIAMFTVLLYCGIRRGELLGLKVRDIDMDRRMLTVRAETSKSGIDRTVPLNSQVISTLKDYLEELRKKGYNSPYLLASDNRDGGLTVDGLKHLINKIIRESGVRFHIHQFRHTFAVNVVNQGCDISKLKQLMGHKDIKMTAKYLRCLPTGMMRGNVEGLSLDNLV